MFLKKKVVIELMFIYNIPTIKDDPMGPVLIINKLNTNEKLCEMYTIEDLEGSKCP